MKITIIKKQISEIGRNVSRLYTIPLAYGITYSVAQKNGSLVNVSQKVTTFSPGNVAVHFKAWQTFNGRFITNLLQSLAANNLKIGQNLAKSRARVYSPGFLRQHDYY